MSRGEGSFTMVTKKRVTPAKTVSPDAEQDRSAPEVRVLRRFRLVFNAVKTHLQQVEKKAGVGGAQLWALSVIHAHPGIGVNSLAAFMDIHQTTASNLVKVLVTADMIAAEKSAPDRRAVQLRILPAGARAAKGARSIYRCLAGRAGDAWAPRPLSAWTVTWRC